MTVKDNPAERRYEIYEDDALAGLAAYRLGEGRIEFIHTEVDPAFQGRGIASRLIGEALADVRRRGLAVWPYCPFVSGYIGRHPEWLDLVPASERSRFGLVGARD